jgi:flagellar biosynthetic protein FlhB
MSETSAQDKSFDATPSRLERARREGDVAISRELNGAAAYIGLYLAIAAGVAVSAPQVAIALAALQAKPEDFSPLLDPEALRTVILAATLPAIVFLVGPAAGAATSLIVQQSVVIAFQRIKPKLSRLSPVANAKHKFGPDGLMEFARSASVLAFVFAGLAWVWAGRLEDLPGAAFTDGSSVGALLAVEIALFVGALAAISLAVGLIDVFWARTRRRKRLMMTLEEVKRDAKESEGDPFFKSARRERAKAVATNRMLADVPKASVVVVNPEHYAVALKWEGPKSGPPVCVAKGVDKMAAKIRELAAASGVPIRRDAPTARAIYAAVDVGQEIRREHFAAIAAAIHFAETVRKKAKRP